jgi:uncharacterized membrane protein YcgQ (UPF0703/DUF1980 family)
VKQQNLKYLRTASLALGLAFVSSQVVPGLLAQSPTQSAKPGQQEQKSQTFVGKIVKAQNGKYALLMDEQNGKGAYVDDQEKAKEFEGKNVKVTGVLMASNVIHITDIEAA